MTTPLSSSDLRDLADILDRWNDALINEPCEYTPLGRSAHSVTIGLPNATQPIAHLVLEGDWVGLEFDK